MPEYDAYIVRFTFLTEDGEERWVASPFIMSNKVDSTVLKFAEDVVVPETPTTPGTPSVSDSYKVELPTDNTAISATDFSAILAENATKDVVIESKRKGRTSYSSKNW